MTRPRRCSRPAVARPRRALGRRPRTPKSPQVRRTPEPVRSPAERRRRPPVMQRPRTRNLPRRARLRRRPVLRRSVQRRPRRQSRLLPSPAHRKPLHPRAVRRSRWERRRGQRSRPVSPPALRQRVRRPAERSPPRPRPERVTHRPLRRRRQRRALPRHPQRALLRRSLLNWPNHLSSPNLRLRRRVRSMMASRSIVRLVQALRLRLRRLPTSSRTCVRLILACSHHQVTRTPMKQQLVRRRTTAAWMPLERHARELLM